MNTTPLFDIDPLVSPLISKYLHDIVELKLIQKNEEEKLGDIISSNEEEYLSQKYNVINVIAQVAYAEFKLQWLNRLLIGDLK